MKPISLPVRKLRYKSILLSAILSLAILAALIPQQQPVQAAAAVTCVTYHTVRTGDTTSKIAHTYGLKWKQIAVANKLYQPYRLKVGQRLCIPPKNSPTEYPTATSFKFSVLVVGNRVRVEVTGVDVKSVYIVKVRRTEVGTGGWYKLGILRVGKKQAVTAYYTLPKDLAKATYLSVCLKNATTDELICRTVVHY